MHAEHKAAPAWGLCRDLFTSAPSRMHAHLWKYLTRVACMQIHHSCHHTCAVLQVVIVSNIDTQLAHVPEAIIHFILRVSYTSVLDSRTLSSTPCAGFMAGCNCHERCEQL